MVGKCITVKVKSTVGFYSLVKSIFQEKNLRLFLGIYYKLHGFKHAVRKIGSYEILIHLKFYWDFPGGAVVKNLSANAGDTGPSPGPGRSHMPRSN